MTIILLLLIIAISGCDTDIDKTITGDHVLRESRDISHIKVSPDSLYKEASHALKIGLSAYSLAGRYDTTEAFSVFKFDVERVNMDDLVDAYITFDIDDSWRDGEAEFAMYETNTDWADTTKLDSDAFLSDLGEPLSVSADTSSIISSMTFDIDHELVLSWSEKGAVLVKSSENGTSMVSFLTDDTNYPPVLKLVKEIEPGVLDTTGVSSSEGSYGFVSDSDDEYLISNGAASGYVLHVGVPETVTPLSTINKSIIRMTVTQSIIPNDDFLVGIYKLKSKFTNMEDLDKDTDTYITVTLTSEDEYYDLDLTEIMNDWHIGGDTNYGLFFEPMNSGSSPNQCVLTPSDSLSVTITPFPKVF